MTKAATVGNPVGYENDICDFCGAKEAGYSRKEDGKMKDACLKCAKEGTPNEESRTT